MWTRKDLKDNAKRRFTANYWWSVLAAVVLTLILGGSLTVSNKIDMGDIKRAIKGNAAKEMAVNSEIRDAVEDIKDAVEDIAEDEDFNIVINGHEVLGIEGAGINEENKEKVNNALDSFAEKMEEAIEENKPEEIAKTVMPLAFPIIIAAMGIALFASMFGIAFQILVRNPLEVGGRKFFKVNHSENAKMDNFVFGYKNNFGNVIKIMFLRDLFIFLWSLLFVIPGIIKAYEYRMIPYLLSDDPNMDTQTAFERSKQMMRGNKWKAFVLDLSFIGWHILSGLTFGILGIFYVRPYVFQTEAELYFALKGNGDAPAMGETTEYSSYVEVE